MLTERSVGTYTVSFNSILDDHFCVYAIECSRDQRYILCGKSFVEADASDIQRVGTSDIADAVDSRDEGVECPSRKFSTIALFSGCECVAEKEARLADESRDTYDLEMMSASWAPETRLSAR